MESKPNEGPEQSDSLTSVLGTVTIKVANLIGQLDIAIPSQILLDRDLGGTVCLSRHEGFVSHDARFSKGLASAPKEISDEVHLERAGGRSLENMKRKGERRSK